MNTFLSNFFSQIYLTIAAFFLRIFFCAVAICSCSGISIANDISKKGLTRDEMLRRLVAAIPSGREIAIAQKILSANGFGEICIMKAPFVECDSNNIVMSHDSSHYLYAVREDTVSFMVCIRWQVALLIREDKVADIWISKGLVGP